jgi:aminotransferase in exopolysaccharide biosynthesis
MNSEKMREIPLSVPNLNIEIAEHLRECVQTGWVSTGGRFITEFEEKVAAYIGVSETVACQSGTAGLHTALRILGIGPGDLVIVPTLTFIATVNPVRYLGADPVFMDCDDSLCIDPVKLKRYCLEECHLTFDETGKHLVCNTSGRTVRAIIPTHIFGNLSDMEKIMDIAATYGLKVLEDAAEAMGSFYESGRYKGRHAGTIGDMGVFSFNANKIITTGGGGMICARNAEDADKARYLTTTAKDDNLFFAHDEVGYNYRMLNLQAALGVSQIDELEKFIEVKQRNYELYQKLLGALPGLRLLPFCPGTRANHWFYSLYIDTGTSTEPITRRDALMYALIDEGIQCRPLWKLIHTQKAYSDCYAFEIEKAIDYEKHILNLPCSTNLSEDDVEYVCEKIASHASHA